MVKGIRIGIAGSAIWLAFIVLFRFNSLHTLKTMPLNEFAGFLAGVIGPLALFWLLLGYWFQVRELNARVEDLKAQVDQLTAAARVDTPSMVVSQPIPMQNGGQNQRATRPLWLVSALGSADLGNQSTVHNILISNAGGTVSEVKAKIGGAGLDDWSQVHPTAFDQGTQWNVDFTLSNNFDVQFGRLTLACRLANGADLEMNVPFSKPKGAAEVEWFVDETYPT